MTFTPVNESSTTTIKKITLRSTITVKKAGSHTLVDQALATTIIYRKVVSPTMIAPDTADSAKSPAAKLSSAELSASRLFPTMDLIPVTSKTTMDHALATLPLQALESLCDGFFLDRYFDSIQEAVEIAIKELTPQDQSKFMHGVYELFADIYEVSKAQVAWLSKFEEDNAGWRELGNKRYYDYLRTIDSSAQQKIPELLEILNEGDGSEKWLRVTALATRTAKDPELAKRYLNYTYVSRIIKLGWKSKEDQSCTCTLSLSAPLPNRQIPSASTVLTASAPPTEEEKLSDFEAPTPSKSLSSEDSSLKIPDIPDTTPDDVTEAVDDITEVVDNVTEVVDDVTEVVNEDDEATSSDNESSVNESSDNESSETAVTPTPIRTKASHERKRAGQPPTPNPTEDKPIDGYDAVVTCSNYMECDIRYTHLVGEEERMITYHHGIYGKHMPLIVQRAINLDPMCSRLQEIKL
ncbi:hypothetical protein K440DRAFT_644105 [Wilcoxina mikolae CBS 423.85]|nr:hypothetical protein K440DRAFT_644105 [Wilcoxina mikolae CBS 423.85]